MGLRLIAFGSPGVVIHVVSADLALAAELPPMCHGPFPTTGFSDRDSDRRDDHHPAESNIVPKRCRGGHGCRVGINGGDPVRDLPSWPTHYREKDRQRSTASLSCCVQSSVPACTDQQEQQGITQCFKRYMYLLWLRQ
jgi:hypothetical protein